MCKIDLIVLTSWLGLEDLTNVSLSQIHQSLLYGFELNFCDDCNEKSTTSGKLIQHFSGPKCNVLIPLAILGVSLLVMIIIGIAGVLALSFTPTSLLENILQYSYYDQTMLAANHIVFIGDTYIVDDPTYLVVPAKLCATNKKAVTLTAARGTIGYVAPELVNRSIGAVSYKADVYSFGMLLMEMVNLNKDLTSNDDNSSKYFPNWIYDHLNEDNRPSMNEVLEMLEGDVKHLQIPDYSTYMARNEDEHGATDSNASISLLHDNNDSHIVEIIKAAVAVELCLPELIEERMNSRMRAPLQRLSTSGCYGSSDTTRTCSSLAASAIRSS
ncbi:hypothetical protein SASPL_150854 [Salvia splendens]|uniref:Serine-threonine/tyrosine-protein kinase catalytic domain-containing protein n=1 Tax=Salvia splendens TaxID=180675 RepID=A0A8X8W877_SALSN|nr:hypothetical protein SASPL_150854 [Salvia splendens]